MKLDEGQVCPLRWVGDALEVIDQRELPGALKLVRIASVDGVIDAIQQLAVRGAPVIGACGAFGVVLSLTTATVTSVTELRLRLEQDANRLSVARPTAATLARAVRRVRDSALKGQTPELMRSYALDEAVRIVAEDREACRRIGEAGRSLLSSAQTLLTLCNTGRLATLGWGTALGVVYAKAAAGEPVSVFVSESRPLLQGARLTMWELDGTPGVDATLLVDGAAASLLSSGRVDAVIVGADRIARNGDTANKIGTYALAVAADRACVPLYVAAGLDVFDPETESGNDIPIEIRAGDEVRGYGGYASAPTGVNVWNPAFDVTPRELIAGYITDEGVVESPSDLGTVRYLEEAQNG